MPHLGASSRVDVQLNCHCQNTLSAPESSIYMCVCVFVRFVKIRMRQHTADGSLFAAPESTAATRPVQGL